MRPGVANRTSPANRTGPPGPFSSSNYATYFADDAGRIACCGLDYADSYWFDDGYADHIRHYLWAMAAIPEFAPTRENHLLRSSSVVTHVSYGRNKIQYKTFDPDAGEVLRLAAAPAQITADAKPLPRSDDPTKAGFTARPLPGGDWIVRIRHHAAREINVNLSH